MYIQYLTITSHMRDILCVVPHMFSHVKCKYLPCKSLFTRDRMSHDTCNLALLHKTCIHTHLVLLHDSDAPIRDFADIPITDYLLADTDN